MELCGSYIHLRGNASWEQTHLSAHEIAVGENQSNQSGSGPTLNMVHCMAKTNKAISQLLLFKWNLPKHKPDNLCSIIIDEKGSPIFEAQCRYLNLYIAFHFKQRMKQHKEDFISESSTSKHSA